MRFRIPNQGAQDLSGGIGNLFRSIAMAPLYQAQAADEAAGAEIKRRLTQSQIDENQAQIGTHVANAALKQRELDDLKGRPDALRLMAASRLGVSVPEFNAAVNERMHGAPEVGPPMLSAPIAGVGPSGRTANYDAIIANLYAPAMASPAAHTNFDQLAQMEGHRQANDLMGEAADAVRSGNFMRSSALSTVLGKKEFTPFKAVGNTGTALNEVTGAQPVTNPAMNLLFDSEGRALIGQRNAAAGASGAAAGASTALRDLRREQVRTEQAEGGIKRLDLEAAVAGEPLPSSNRVSRGADSTNSKFRNQIIAAAMKKPEFGVMSQAEKMEFLNNELMLAGLDPVQHNELVGKGPAGAVRGTANASPIDAQAATGRNVPPPDGTRGTLNGVKGVVRNGRFVPDGSPAEAATRPSNAPSPAPRAAPAPASRPLPRTLGDVPGAVDTSTPVRTLSELLGRDPFAKR